MPSYRYTASAIDGKMVKGEMDATDEKQLKDNLTLRKLYLVSCETYTKQLITKQLSQMDISDMCRQIGSMLQAGITAVRALNILQSRDMSANMKVVIDYLYKQIKLGNALSEAMRDSGAFPSLLVNMVESGEASGNTEAIMLRMATYYENEYKTQRSIKSALAYPMFLAGLLVVAVIGIFTFIIPQFMTVFDGMELPALTQAVLNISDFMKGYWYIMIGVIVGLVFLVKALLTVPKIQVFCSKQLLHMGKVGRLFGIIYTARFCRTFSALYSSGLSIIKAFQISKNTIGSPYIAFQFDDLIRDIRQGVSIADGLAKVDGFDQKLKSSVLIGEESGRLEFMLETMADSFEFESDQSIKKLTGMVEPVMICAMGAIVAIVFVSVMMPIFSLYESF